MALRKVTEILHTARRRQRGHRFMECQPRVYAFCYSHCKLASRGSLPLWHLQCITASRGIPLLPLMQQGKPGDPPPFAFGSLIGKPGARPPLPDEVPPIIRTLHRKPGLWVLLHAAQKPYEL